MTDQVTTVDVGPPQNRLEDDMDADEEPAVTAKMLGHSLHSQQSQTPSRQGKSCHFVDFLSVPITQ